MFKNFLNWLGELERKNSFSFGVVIFAILFILQLIIKLIFNTNELVTEFWKSIEQVAFFSLAGALIMFYFAARKKIER